jgi:hypothetical protein
MIIDSHTHVGEAPIFGRFDPPEAIIRLMDEARIDKAIVMTYRDAPGPEEGVSEHVAEAVQRYPDRLIGYARMTPRYGASAGEFIDRAIRENGMSRPMIASHLAMSGWSRLPELSRPTR